jgi:hypothetical protein
MRVTRTSDVSAEITDTVVYRMSLSPSGVRLIFRSLSQMPFISRTLPVH